MSTKTVVEIGEALWNGMQLPALRLPRPVAEHERHDASVADTTAGLSTLKLREELQLVDAEQDQCQLLVCCVVGPSVELQVREEVVARSVSKVLAKSIFGCCLECGLEHAHVVLHACQGYGIHRVLAKDLNEFRKHGRLKKGRLLIVVVVVVVR